MKKKIKIICTLGPSSLNRKFLEYSKKNINILRLNMSHLNLNEMQKNILFIRKYTNTQICIDSEGAQIRSKVKKKKFFKKNLKITVFHGKANFLEFYPEYIFNKIKKGDLLNIGFDNLKIKILKKNEKKFSAIVVREGLLENNKGVHIENRKIDINYLTNKDFKAIELAKQMNIKTFALSFTNSEEDINSFNKLLKKNSNKIYKIETKKAVKNFETMIKAGSNFLIDRGDLSKDIDIINIPKVQRDLIEIKKKYKNKNIFIATNLLESMIYNNYPTRGEANDIYSSLEMGADGLVLAAETAVGKYPIECVEFIKKLINNFKKK